MNPARSIVSADYDQGLATCRDFLKRSGCEDVARMKDRLQEVLNEGKEEGNDAAIFLATFAMLGLLAAELAIEEPENE